LTTVLGVDSRWLFVGLFALVAAERLGELALSARNARWARARGGVEVPAASLWPAMLAGHVLFLLAPPLEVFLFDRPWLPALAIPMLGLAAGAMALRYWAVATLGRRWNTRVIVLPGEPVVTGGPYRFVRHPNYLAVAIEVAALPLVHTAWLSALLASAGDAWLLAARIRREEAALAAAGDYLGRLGDRPRLLPGVGR
jgi:methyltransferase